MILIGLAAPLFVVALAWEWRRTRRRPDLRGCDRRATHELVAIARDVRAATTWGERLGRELGGPGWQPSTPTPQLQEAVA